MPLHPGARSAPGALHTLVAAPPAGTVPASAGDAARARRDLDVLADADAVRKATAHWTEAQMSAVVSVLLAERGKRRESQFVDVLRTLFFSLSANGSPVAKVEFVTTSDADNAPSWDEDLVYLHHSNGTVTKIDDFPLDHDEESEALDDMFRDLLACISADQPPPDGSHLIVDLASGTFERCGRNILY